MVISAFSARSAVNSYIRLSSVKPTQLLAGKILGLGAAGLLQVVFYVAILFVPAMTLFTALDVSLGKILLSLVYFLLGYLLFASLMAGTSVLGNTVQESGQLSAVWMIMSIIPLMLNAPLIQAPDSLLARGLSYFPLTAPVTMLLRIGISRIPPADVLISIATLSLGIYLAVKGAARVLRAASLMYGKRASLSEILRWLREREKEAPRPAIQPFSRQEVRRLLLILFIGLVGLVVGIRFYQAAFPEASIDFKVNRDEAQKLAAEFLRHRFDEGTFDLAAYRATTIFQHNDLAKVYLERELGLEQANVLMRFEVAVWGWESRFFRPLQREEFRVALSPSGRLIGYHHQIEEKAAGTNLERVEAQPIAETFLRSLDIPLAEYTLIEGTTKRRDNRTDHTFVWERDGFKAKEATYRLSVTIQGDRMDGYREFLKIPETWQRDYQTLRSKNKLMQTIATAVFIALGIALLIVLLIELPRKQVTWQFGVSAGIVLGIASIVLAVNSLSLTLFNYPTAQPLSSFYVNQVISAIVGALVFVGIITLVGASGEAVYRQGHPEKVAPRKLFSAPSLRSKEYFEASVVGYPMAMIWFGYVTIFYLLGRKIGIWAPADIKYTNAVSTALPWIYPLAFGLQASILEEFVFRLFAIPFLKRHLKSTFLAVLLPAVAWAFLHSTYPQQPFFIRGVELTVVGIILGYAFLRYGILSTLIAHYVFDVLMVGLFLSTSLYFWTSGVIVIGAMLIPFIPSAMSMVRRRFEVSPNILNAADYEAMRPRVEEEAPRREIPAATQPQGVVAAAVMGTRLTAKQVKVVIGIAIVSALLLVAIRVERFLDFTTFAVNRREAVEIAEAFLKERGLETTAFKRVATVSKHTGMEVRYIRRFAGLSTLNTIYQERLSAVAWRVRFFRPLQKEEWTVWVGLDGTLQSYTHTIEQEAARPTLSQDEAIAIAQESLKKQGISLDPYRLVEAAHQKRDNRTDYLFVWEDTATMIKEGTFRVRLTVQGDEAMGWRQFFKVPEEWVRKEMKRTLRQTVMRGVFVFLMVGVLVWLLVLFGKQVARRAIYWRFSLTVATLVTVLSLISTINGLGTFFAAYNTTQSLANFLTRAIATNIVLKLVGIFLLSAVVMGLLESFYRTAFPARLSIRDWLRQLWRGSPETRVALRDALLLSYTACLVAPALQRLIDLGGQRRGIERVPEAALAPFVTTRLPALDGLIEGMSYALIIPAVLALLAIVALRYLKRPVLLGASLSVFLVLVGGAEAKTWMAFLGLVVVAALLPAAVWIAVVAFYRHNLAAYVLTAFLVTLTRAGWALTTQVDGFYWANGIAILAIAALPAVWYLFSSKLSA